MYLPAFSDHGNAPAFTENPRPPAVAQPVSDSELSDPRPAPGSPVPDLKLPAAAVVVHITDFLVTVSAIVTFPDCFPVKEPPGDTVHPAATAAHDDPALSATASAAAPPASRNPPSRLRI